MHRLARLLSALTASGLAAAATLAQPTQEPAGEAMWAYTVKRGDTLIGLSRELLQPGIGWKRVQRLNRVADPYRLMPGSTLRFPLAWLRLEQSTAEVVFVTGTVQVERAGTPPAALTVGTRLRPSDTLVTGASPSAVALRLVDGSRVMLAPDSRMTIEQLALRGRSGALDTALRLEHGSADSRVVPLGNRPPRYRIDTPAMNLGVRGTEFRVHAPSASNTRLEVLEGSVAAGAAAGAAVQVDAGFGLLAQAGAQPQPARRLLDAPELPAAMPRVERLPMRLPWAALPGATAYRAQVLAAGTLDHLLLDGRFDAPAARWADLPDGRYLLRVRGIDADRLEGRDALVAFVVKARPEPPFASEPKTDARVYGERVELRWARAPQATRVRLQLARSADFAQPLLDRSDLTDTELGLELAHGGYFWRLASIAGADDQGPWSDTQRFVLKPVPASPTLESPAVDARGVVFRWRATPGASYHYQVARDAAFSDLVIEGTTQEAQAQVSEPQPGVYHLRVRTIDADGFEGPYGDAQQVRVPPRIPWWLLLLLLPLL